MPSKETYSAWHDWTSLSASWTGMSCRIHCPHPQIELYTSMTTCGISEHRRASTSPQTMINLPVAKIQTTKCGANMMQQAQVIFAITTTLKNDAMLPLGSIRYQMYKSTYNHMATFAAVARTTLFTHDCNWNCKKAAAPRQSQ